MQFYSESDFGITSPGGREYYLFVSQLFPYEKCKSDTFFLTYSPVNSTWAKWQAEFFYFLTIITSNKNSAGQTRSSITEELPFHLQIMPLVHLCNSITTVGLAQV